MLRRPRLSIHRSRSYQPNQVLFVIIIRAVYKVSTITKMIRATYRVPTGNSGKAQFQKTEGKHRLKLKRVLKKTEVQFFFSYRDRPFQE